MTETETFAWILLSVPDSPGTLQDIIATADCMFRAIPTHRELRTSLGWLKARGLVRKSRRRFCTTDAGSQLVARLSRPHRPILKIWELVTQELEPLGEEPAAPENISLDETERACKGYHKAFWKAYGELERSRARLCKTRGHARLWAFVKGPILLVCPR
jgi:hypothetical protein